MTTGVASPHDLTGRTVVVTGGNGGIGLALARGTGLAGATVSIWGRNEQKNETAVAGLAAEGIAADAVNCDISEEAKVTEAFRITLDRHGAVDAFFANAGIPGQQTPLASMSTDEWRHVLATNLDGAFFCIRGAVRHMLERGQGGAIVGVSSIMSFYGAAQKQHYGASKAGLEALVRGVAVEYAADGIRANSLLPGWTDTELLAPGGGFISEQNYAKVREYTRRRTPVQRWGSPDDIGRAAAFLADPTLTFHTGDRLVVDGAYTAF